MTVSLVSATPTTYTGLSGGDITVTIPASVVDGDWLLLFISAVGGSNFAIPPGDYAWDYADNGFNSCGVAYSPLLATSDASTTFTLTNTGGGDVIAHVYHMRGGDPMLKPPQYEFEVTSGTTTSPDPPAITPDYGSDDYIGFVALWHSATGQTSAAPSGYTNLTNTKVTGGIDDNLATMVRNTTGTITTENPGTATQSVARTVGMLTVVVPTTDPAYTYVEAVVNSSDTSTLTSTFVMDLPASLTGKGCLLGVVRGGTSSAAMGTTPTGWTKLAEQPTPTSDVPVTFYYRDCDGTEGATVTVNLGDNAEAIGFAMRVNTMNFGFRAPEIAIEGHTSTSTPNPPSLVSTRTQAAVLITGAGRSPQKFLSAQGWPTGYVNHRPIRSSEGTPSALMAFGFREVGGFSSPEDPASFTAEEANEGVTFTLALFVTQAGEGSGNLVPLEILEAVQADSGWWVEAWEPDGSAKKLAAVPATSFRYENIINEIGFGEINIPPAGDDPSNPSALRDLLDVLCNPADPSYPVASLVKIFIDGVERYSFFTSKDRLEWSETGTIRVFGPGREAGLDWTFVFPNDNPANPIKAGDFIYGSDDNIVDNGGGEGSSNAIQNPDFETGDATGWDPYLGGDTISVRAADASLFRSGSFSMKVIPTASGSGVKTTLTGLSGDPVQNQAFCRVFIRDKVGAGDTILVKAVYDNAGETILDSATITLSTTWQQVDLSFFVPTTTPEIELVIINNTGTADFWVDDTDCFYSTEPFTKYGAADTFHLDETNVQAGRFSIKVTPDVQYGGIGQILDTVPGRTYRASVAVVGTATEVLELSAVVTGGVFPNQTIVLSGGVDTISFEFTPGPNQEQTRIWLRNLDATPSPFWFDELIVAPGAAATSPGGILEPQVVTAKARGAFAAYSINFDAATDAFGAVWTETALQISHDYGITLRQVADRLVGLGSVEWVVSNSLEWQVANRIGSDLTTLPTDVPTLRATPAVREGAELTERIPEATFVFLEGADGTWTTAADPSLETSIGRREKYIKNQSIEAGATLGKYANAALQDEKDRVFTLNVTLNRDDDLRPYRDFRIGDTILVDLFNTPGASNVPTAYRVRGFRVTGQDEYDISYEVIVNNVEYTTPEGRISRVIDQLVKQGSIVSLSASKGTVGEIQ